MDTNEVVLDEVNESAAAVSAGADAESVPVEATEPQTAPAEAAAEEVADKKPRKILVKKDAHKPSKEVELTKTPAMLETTIVSDSAALMTEAEDEAKRWNETIALAKRGAIIESHIDMVDPGTKRTASKSTSASMGSAL